MGWRRWPRVRARPRQRRRRLSLGMRARRAGSAPRAPRWAGRARSAGRPGSLRPRQAARAPGRRVGSRCPRLAARHAQHPKQHVGSFDPASGFKEAGGLVAQHRSRGQSPEQRAALLDIAVDRCRPSAHLRADVGRREHEIGRVERLPDVGRDHVAQRARAFACLCDAADERRGLAWIERKTFERRFARDAVLARARGSPAARTSRAGRHGCARRRSEGRLGRRRRASAPCARRGRRSGQARTAHGQCGRACRLRPVVIVAVAVAGRSNRRSERPEAPAEPAAVRGARRGHRSPGCRSPRAPTCPSSHRPGTS